LHLGIDTERPARSRGGKNTILDGKFISGEVLRSPLGDLDIVGEECFKLEIILAGDLPGDQVGLPVLEDHLLTESHVEWSTVRQESGGAKAVTNELYLILHEDLGVSIPTLLLSSETSDQFRGSIQSACHAFSGVLEVSKDTHFLSLVFVKLGERSV